MDWEIRISIGLARKWAEKKIVDLLGDDTKSIMEFESSVLLRTEAIWDCVEKQAKEREITQEDFFDSLDAKGLLALDKKLTEAIDFFIQNLNPNLQATTSAMRKKIQSFNEKKIQAMAEIVDEASPEMDEALKRVKSEAKAKMTEEFGKISSEFQVTSDSGEVTSST